MHPEQDKFIEQLHHDYHNKLTIYALASMRDKNCVQDVVQDTFHEAVNRIERVMDHENPGGWLMNALKNKMHESERARQKNLLLFISLDTDIFVEPGTYDKQLENLHEEDEAQVLEKIEQALKPDEFLFLKRLTLDRISHIEAAKEFGISVYTSQKRLERIRKKLYKVFPERKKRKKK